MDDYPWLKLYFLEPGCPEPFKQELSQLFAISHAARRWQRARVHAITIPEGTWGKELLHAEQEFWAQLPPYPEQE